MRSRIHTWGWETLDFLFPPRCAGCDKWGERYCESCQEQTKIIGSSICQVCGEPHTGTSSHVCQRCQITELFYINLRSWAYFEGPLQKAIHKLKYKRDLGLGEKLALPLVNLLKVNNWDIDLITAVPLDASRKRDRGFNQSLCLARPLAWKTGLPVVASIIKRIRKTRSQVGLSLEERRINVTGAFLAEKKLVKGKSILIIDDVVTTGSTINSCAEALMKAEASKVYGLTLARSTRLRDALVLKLEKGGIYDN